MAIETHGPLLAGVSWILVIISCIALFLRIYCKSVRSRGLWWDDVILISAWLFLCIGTCLLSVTISLGFGKHLKDIDPKVLPCIGLLGKFSGLFAILAAMLSKISFALTLLRIDELRMRLVLYFIIITVSLALGTLALFAWIQCAPIAGIVFGGFYSGCMDVLLSLLPWKWIWKLQLKKKEKVAISLAMSIGVFSGVTAVIKSVYIPHMGNEDFSYIGTQLILWNQAEPSVSILAASIPFLRGLLRDASGNYFQSSNCGGDTGELKLTNGPRSRTTTAITSAGRTLRASTNSTGNTADDDGRGILGNMSEVSVEEKGIMKATEVAVEYHYGNDLDGHEEFGFELRKIGD